MTRSPKPDASDVLREGLRLIEQREAEDAAKLAALREAARTGVVAFEAGQFGAFSDVSDMRNRLRRTARVIARSMRR